MACEITISEELRHFIKEHASDHYAFQLILFFADHPRARFNELAVIHALNQNGGKRYIQKALSVLVDRGMIKTYVNNNILLYSLPDDMRSRALELARLDTYQRHLLIKQMYSDSVRSEGYLLRKMAGEVFLQISEASVISRQNPAVFD